ncbi:hypothetical protein HDU67_007144 [Dinochytrium kinnereticum]|nr:hypothetical protein HDU67_007144 [Dinochytrium kinnereticum]
MKFIIEHMEEGLSDWVKVEYAHMITTVGKGNLILSGMTKDTLASIPPSLEGAEATAKTVLEITSMEKVLLLDPSSPTPLAPEDASAGYEYFLFGGILGDDPPRDRTKELRKLGFATRHLGPIQMTTDTAVLVSHRILTGTPMDRLNFVDRPSVQLYKNESVEMPFRYLVDDSGKPIMPPGFIEVLKKSNDEGKRKFFRTALVLMQFLIPTLSRTSPPRTFPLHHSCTVMTLASPISPASHLLSRMRSSCRSILSRSLSTTSRLLSTCRLPTSRSPLLCSQVLAAGNVLGTRVKPTSRTFMVSVGMGMPMPSPGAVGATVRKAPMPRIPRKAALTLTPKAVARLKELISDPTNPKLLKVGTRKKGCSGQTYTLEYVELGKHSKLDEVIEQDDVRVLIDSKALFSLIGSEMDFIQDELSSQFVFNNPNVKEMCGCGQSFMV